MPREKKGRGEFRTVSLPSSLVEEVERMVDSLRYWPTKTDFVREAVLEKLDKYSNRGSERSSSGQRA